MSRSRWAAVGAAVAVSVGGGGLLTASAASESGSGASSTISVVPCRFLDTRLSTGERTTPLGGGETVTLPAFGTHGGCTIPANATALVANLTTVNQSASGYLTVFPDGADRPTTSMLNWLAGDDATGNEVIVKLSTAGSFSVFNFAGTTDVVIDVVAYHVPASSGTGPQGAAGPQGAPGPAGEAADMSVVADLETRVAALEAYVGNVVNTDWVNGENATIVDANTMVLESRVATANAGVAQGVPAWGTISDLNLRVSEGSVIEFTYKLENGAAPGWGAPRIQIRIDDVGYSSAHPINPNYGVDNGDGTFTVEAVATKMNDNAAPTNPAGTITRASVVYDNTPAPGTVTFTNVVIDGQPISFM